MRTLTASAAALLALGLSAGALAPAVASTEMGLVPLACGGSLPLSLMPEVSVQLTHDSVKLAVSAEHADTVSGVEWRYSHFSGDQGWEAFTDPIRLPGYDMATKVEYRAVRFDGTYGTPTTLTESTVPTCIRTRVLTPKAVHGKPVRFAVTVDYHGPDFGADMSGPVRGGIGVSQRSVNGFWDAWADLKNGQATVDMPSLKAGKQRVRIAHAYDRRFGVTDQWVTVDVAKAPSKVKVTSSKVRSKGTVRIKASSTTGVKLGGTVVAKVTKRKKGKRVVVATRTADVTSKGVATVKLPKKVRKSKGSYRMTVTYRGTSDVARSTANKKLTWRVR